MARSSTRSSGTTDSSTFELLKQIESKTKEQILAEHKQGVDTVLNLFKESSGSSLRAWLRAFDKNMDMCVHYSEFTQGLMTLNYPDDPLELFRKVDLDGSGEIMLEELDLADCQLWMAFRMWCAAQFDDPKHMICELTNDKAQTVCGVNDFITGLKRLGWTEGHEDTLFQCIDKNDEGIFYQPHLRWFARDKKKQIRKEQAKKNALKHGVRHLGERQQIAKEVQHFKTFLKRKYTTLLRAWRCALDLDGSMTVQKHELFKAVKAMNWPGDMRLLWKGLDKDSSGVTSLQELDIRSAERLAKFKEFSKDKFGSAVEAFRALDFRNKKMLKEQEFIEACKKQGFPNMTAALFHGLDWERNRYIKENDLAFLDSWRCPAYLSCKPNDQAAQEFKACLLNVYKNYLKAWRVCLDRDNSNCVAWEEFEAAAKKIRFTGDLPGAWRSLDDDVSGFISLREICTEASKVISEFKCWADREFGSVRHAFKILDQDGKGELSMKEWRKACMAYAYPGDSRALFFSLDSDNSGVLTMNEVTFVDTWELSSAQLAEIYPEGQPPEEQEKKPVKTVVEMSARMHKLARPKIKMPVKENTTPFAVSNLDTSFMDLASSQDPWPCKSKGGVSPYLPKLHPISPDLVPSFPDQNFLKSCPDNNTLLKVARSNAGDSVDPPAPTRMEQLKALIENTPIVQRSRDAWLRAEEYERFDLSSVKQRTRDLRNRTVSILKKVEHSEQQFHSLPSDGFTEKAELSVEDLDLNIENPRPANKYMNHYAV